MDLNFSSSRNLRALRVFAVAVLADKIKCDA
jgi:hypothetical protein